MLKTHRFPDHEAMSRDAADRLADRLRTMPHALFCLATGATPTLAYQLLAQRRTAEPGLFDRAGIIKLDERGGPAMDDPPRPVSSTFNAC